MRIVRLLCVGCCLLFLCGITEPTQAQTSYDIDGIVYGPNSTPLEQIVVSLQNQARAQIAQSITTNDGRYQFSRISAGIYYLIVKPNELQYKQAIHRIELIDTARFGATVSQERVDITLNPAQHRDQKNSSGIIFAQPVPPDAEKEYGEAMKNLVKGEKEKASAQLKQAIATFPRYFLALQQLGLLYVETEKFQQAVAPLRAAFEINPKASQSQVGLGIAYLNLNSLEEAVAALQQARTLDAKSFRAPLYLGIALLNLNRLDEAEGFLRQAYALGGALKAQAAHLYLASIYSKRQQYRQAIDELQAYLRVNPKAANASNIQQAIQRLKAKL
ncbi:MAG: tetratricopeptide repeat protein [Pyrinomonadaceae bacterium]